MSIGQRQNSEPGLRLLKAAQVANSRVARMESARLVLSLVLVLAVLATTVYGDQPGPLLAIVGSFWAILSAIVLVPSSRRLRNESCLIQEQFDTYVFDLPWNPAMGSKVDLERVHELSYRFTGGVDKIVDWYPDTSAHRPLDVLISQRANVNYDIRLRERWRRIVIGLLASWIAAGVAVGVITSMTVWSLLLTWFAPSSAAIILAYEIIFSQNKALNERRSILPGINRAIETIREEKDRSKLASYGFLCRNFQDAIFDTRQHTNRVPSWFYRLSRSTNEKIMRAATAAERTET